LRAYARSHFLFKQVYPFVTGIQQFGFNPTGTTVEDLVKLLIQLGLGPIQARFSPPAFILLISFPR
jgi:hypothetical protein